MPKKPKYVFSDSVKPGTWCVRRYDNWEIIATFPDDQEGYNAGLQWVEDNGYTFVPWD